MHNEHCLLVAAQGFIFLLPYFLSSSALSEEQRKLAAIQAPKTRIAVLPFENISPDPNDSYFADGLTEELITVLSQIKGLRVIAKTSVSRFKGTDKGVSQIGSELRVGSILEGSVRKSANKIRVTVQLIDVASEEHLWVSQYDRDLNDIFLIQSDIAKKVSDELRVNACTLGRETR